MSDQHTLKQWIALMDAGAFEGADVHTQINAGWYDWFCRDSALANKTRKLARMVKRVAKSAKVNGDSMYVFFKNNCPVNGSLYDDFRICDVESGDVIWTVIPRSGHKCDDGQAELWGRENHFNGPILVGTMKDIYHYFGV
jgi:hypothetical protein